MKHIDYLHFPISSTSLSLVFITLSGSHICLTHIQPNVWLSGHSSLLHKTRSEAARGVRYVKRLRLDGTVLCCVHMRRSEAN